MRTLRLDSHILSTMAEGCCRPHSGRMLLHPKITRFTGAVADLHNTDMARDVLCVQLALHERLASSASAPHVKLLPTKAESTTK